MHARGTAIAIAAVLSASSSLGALGCGGSNGSEPTETEAEETQAPQPQEAERPLPALEERGRDLFADTCGSCHTFEAAGTQGSIGPSLDEVPLNRDEVLQAIEIVGRGTGNMPPNLLSGEEAESVATFIANNRPGN